MDISYQIKSGILFRSAQFYFGIMKRSYRELYLGCVVHHVTKLTN